MNRLLYRAGQWLVALMVAQSATAYAATPAVPPVSPSPAFDASPEMQQKRLALINSLISQGVFQKIEKPRRLPHLWVRPAFYALDFDMKQKFSNVVYAYFKGEDPAMRLVVLYDSRTGKQAGRFSEDLGGLDLD